MNEIKVSVLWIAAAVVAMAGVGEGASVAVGDFSDNYILDIPSEIKRIAVSHDKEISRIILYGNEYEVFYLLPLDTPGREAVANYEVSDNLLEVRHQLSLPADGLHVGEPVAGIVQESVYFLDDGFGITIELIV